ncbi:16S rRNA (guanine(527)-N(7))-methyltransferase RsmG [Ancylomarina sp. 16SWW S1-10-2]|uniref:16S rRNA (guanine(527)-N(7))-methyltransferase RsmG n=1 Tax=Ancylomarina sp. 16SWW S1-10-2 TaxID=2499681 RepID=UPI0012AD5467|nr:16S rRNA (guanine(527)-N(7))-methyltransferase RsmG [Ancylomarina sp. 16SWW S1-10-2]MRT94845.1 16S rRNA (guanine(527)-N(7))-methyltransferase RsmG [Ancylomarina sp. 16SWW S1-10-2]
MELILKYFKNLTDKQKEQFAQLKDLYKEWNDKINVISRKDIDFLYLHHVLHSLAIAKVIQFQPGSTVLDVGTGGGFPGIPLAILYPESNFHLIDSIGKKIKVVNEVSHALGLKNVTSEHTRVQEVKTKYDFIVSRAVTAFPAFVNMVKKNAKTKNINALPNGIIYIKGGNFEAEIKAYGKKINLFDCTDFFTEDFFETKKVVHMTL